MQGRGQDDELKGTALPETGYLTVSTSPMPHATSAPPRPREAEPGASLPWTGAGGVIAAMMAHRSVRSFSDRPLPEGLLETLIAAGQAASTSSYMQTVSVVAIEKRETRMKLATIARQDFLAATPVVLCFIADLSRAGRVGEAIDADLFALPMLDNFLAACTDCAIFAQNVALAAQSCGLGICFIGNLRNEPLEIARLLGLPPRAVAIFGLCIGYEEGNPTGQRPRLPQGVVLHRETYTTADEAALIDGYDVAVGDHEETQGRPRTTWRGRHPMRFASYDYLSGREKLREQLETLGFPLL